MTRAQALSCTLVAFSLVACGASGSDALRSPRDFRATEEVYDQLSVSWAASAGETRESVWVELSFDGSPFQFRGEFPASSGGATLRLTSQSTELARVEVRGRTGRPSADGQRTDWSNWSTASYQRGIRPPSITATRASIEGATAIHVAWTVRSSIADALSIERIDTPIDGSAPTTIAMPLSAGARSFDDVDVRARRFYRYRIRAGRAGVWSAPVDSDEVLISAITPWRIAAEQVAEGVRLSWTPPFETAVTQTIRALPAPVLASSPQARALPTPIIAIPASATAWIDTRIPAWPTQSYQLSVSGLDARGDNDSVLSERMDLTPFTFESAGQRFSAYRFEAPAPPAARAPDGTWWLRSDETLWRQTPTGWDVTTATGLFGSDILFEGATPHRLTTEGSDSYVLHQWWSGGSAWSQEQIPTPSRSAAAKTAFAFGPDRAMHILYVRGTAYRIIHAARDGAGWPEEELPTPERMLIDAISVAVAADGTVYAAIGPNYVGASYLGGFVFCSRPAAQPWSCVPTDVSGTLLGLFATAHGPVAVLHRTTELTAVSFDGTGWTTHSAPGIHSDPPALAVSPDGSAVAVLAFDYDPSAYWDRGALRLLTFDGVGWTDRTIAPAVDISYPDLHVGFVGSRLWATSFDYPSGVAAWEQQ